MQQRRVRLGDIVDDYCPRERRITNHAVVAMVEDEVKQTRCATCDAEHEYKQAKVPAQRRRKDAPAGASGEAVGVMPRKRVAAEREPATDEAPEPSPETAVDESSLAPQNEAVAPLTLAPEDVSTDEAPADLDDDGPVHRPLIRATLPRPEGHVPERKVPEFTAHQRGDANGNRPGRGPRRGPRHGQTRGPQQGSGTGPFRFGGPRHGQGQRQGAGGGQRPGSPHGQRSGGGRPGQRGQGQPGQQRQGGRKRGR